MKRLAIALLGLTAFSAQALTIEELAERLKAIDCFRARVSYTVSLPQAADDVRYAISLESRTADGDTLSPVNYLIDWTFKSAAGETLSGYSAYFNGHHYRYRNDRMQQWHSDKDAAAFRKQGRGAHAFKGVHRSVQFANLLPAFIGADIEDMLADSLYSVELLTEPPGVRAVMEIHGQKAVETVYTFQPETLLPLSISTHTGEGSISEQELAAQYVYPDTSAPCLPIDAARMAGEKPETFGSAGTITPESMVGRPLPSFTLQSTRGQRITHLRNQEFGVATMIVVLDPAEAEAAEAVKAVREAAAQSSDPIEIVWASTAANPQTAIELLGQLQPGEALGINAGNIVRDWGITSLPAAIFCNPDATVNFVLHPLNKSTSTIVTQTVKQLKN